MASSRSVIVAAAAVSVTSAQPAFLYELTGACDEHKDLNGLSFLNVGTALSGAPFYKALGHEYYIYHDMDCANCGDENPRWIIDDDMPNIEASHDLDGDEKCQYIARSDSSDLSSPPVTGEWVMNCGGVQKIVEITLVNHDPTTDAPSESTTGSSDTTSGSPDGESHPSLTLSGVCEYHQAWEGLTWKYMGTTADGSPFYKAQDVEEYIYYDADCDGSGANTDARWVLDDSRPSLKALEDLDLDGECNYHARLTSLSGNGGPPESATWQMYCGDSGWMDVELTLAPNEEQEDVLVAAARGAGSTLVAFGAFALARVVRMIVA